MKLSVIISNRNDVAMLSVTIRSCIEQLRPLGLENCEIVIVDNSDIEYYRILFSVIPSGYIEDGLIKIIRQDFPCLFTAREIAAKNSLSEYILCVDSHMVIGHNMFLDLYNFMEERKDDKTLGFAHAPINWAHQHERSSKHYRDMSECELGNWGERKTFPSTITWKGMPWICRKDFFLNKKDGIGAYGALSQHKLSWGGGDMHIGIKPWMLGFKNWAVPTSPGIHIGPFPKIDTGIDKNSSKVGAGKYRLWSNSGIGPHAIGFLVSCYVIGGMSMMERNRSAVDKRFGSFINTNEWWDKAIEMGSNEKLWLDENKKLSFDELLSLKPWDN